MPTLEIIGAFLFAAAFTLMFLLFSSQPQCDRCSRSQRKLNTYGFENLCDDCFEHYKEIKRAKRGSISQ